MPTNESFAVTLTDVESALAGFEAWYARTARDWMQREPSSPEEAQQYRLLWIERDRARSDFAHVRGLLTKACQAILDSADAQE